MTVFAEVADTSSDSLAEYAFEITGHFCGGESTEGVTGPVNAPADLLALVEAGEGTEFLLFDDAGLPADDPDGADIRGIHGRFLARPGADPEAQFGPLETFGAEHGLTQIAYRNPKTGWFQSL